MSGPSRVDAAAAELEHGAVPEHALATLARSTSHGRPARASPRGPQLPAAAHPQVAAQDEPALELEQQVLPDRLDALEPAAVEPGREPQRLGARVRRLDLEPLTDERLQPRRRSVEAVSLGHAGRVRPGRAPCPRH